MEEEISDRPPTGPCAGGLWRLPAFFLEPWYTFRLEVPEASIGRAMTDIEKRCGTCVIEENRQGQAVLTGQAPVAAMRGYQSEVISYTRGQGRLACTLKGYEPCHNSREIIGQTGYDPDRDTENPTGSVFCAHGAGFVVSWDRVKEYMHVDSGIVIESPGGEEMEGEESLFRRNQDNPLPDRTLAQKHGWVRMRLTPYWSAPFIPTAGISQRAKDIPARAGEAGAPQPTAAR